MKSKAGTPKHERPPRRGRPPQGVARQTELARLRQENHELRVALDLKGGQTELQWEQIGPQALRDRLAATALLGEWGNINHATVRLGFSMEALIEAKTLKETQARIFDTPGVREILARDLKDATQNRINILERVTHIALYGTDESATRAAQTYAKLSGWMAPEEAPKQIVNLYTLVGAGSGGRAGMLAEKEAADLQKVIDSSDPLALLSHEPGAPVRIAVDDDAVNELARKNAT